MPSGRTNAFVYCVIILSIILVVTVRQDNMLGPLLFLCHIGLNDLPDGVKSQMTA